jgi:hypothetical protein
VQNVVQQYIYGLPAINSLGLKAAVIIHGKGCDWLKIACYDESAKKVPFFMLDCLIYIRFTYQFTGFFLL